MGGNFHTITRNDLTTYVLEAGRRYWPAGAVPDDPCREDIDPGELGSDWCYVELPEWAADIGIDGRLLVDRRSIASGPGTDFERCDWFLAGFAHLSGIAQVKIERSLGPAHSYSFRLKGIPSDLFDRAWANRIMLFIRRRAARLAGKEEDAFLGPMPEGQITLTHDVDALDKTVAIRLKQGLFNLFNLVRLLARGDIREARSAALGASRMVFARLSYDHLETVAEMAEARGLISAFHLYAGRGAGNPGLRKWLFDPSYRIDDPRLLSFVRKYKERGFEFGLHPSFESWNSTASITREKEALERTLGVNAKTVRQHWLRFSWEGTWRAQSESGLSVDSTLGFNDRSGFRAGAALTYRPWDFVRNRPHDIAVLPLVLMDSHLYDYSPMTPTSRRAAMAGILGEVMRVGGEGAVLWHPHALASDYGWREGFEDLLDLISRQ